MNLLTLFTSVYSALHSYPYIPYWVLTPFRKLVRYAANLALPKYLAQVNVLRGEKENGVIISFTSFPARINNVWLVVKSLKNQSVLPEKIILWLSKEQFPKKETIPDSLWREEDSLFEIRMVDNDIRSHKKYYYVMQEFPEKAFVTCDDDIYYHPDMLKYLLEANKMYPNCVIANITRQIQFSEEGFLLPYQKWAKTQEPFASKDQIQIGVGGVLYPPNALHELTLRKDLFFTLTPLADDIWLNCMARMNGTPTVHSAMNFLPLPINSKAPSLSTSNRGGGKNDEQLQSLGKWLDGLLINPYSDNYHIEYKKKE